MTENTPTPIERVFVAGATSLAGRAVVRHLNATGKKVTGSAVNAADAAIVRADGGVPTYPNLTRAGEVRSAATTLGKDNLAFVNLIGQSANGLPFFPVNWTEVAALIVNGTAALIDAAKQVGASYFLHGSFAFADVHSEDESVNAVVKAVKRAERLVIASGLPYAILRFGYTYGDSPALRELVSNFKAGRPVYTSDRHAHAGWIHADDAAAAVAAALDSQAVGSLLTAVDDHAASPAEFLGYFLQGQGLGVPSASGLTAPLARLALGAAQYGLLNGSSHPNNADTKTLLGWQPRFSTYQQGLDDVLLSWRAAMKV